MNFVLNSLLKLFSAISSQVNILIIPCFIEYEIWNSDVKES